MEIRLCFTRLAQSMRIKFETAKSPFCTSHLPSHLCGCDI